MIFYFDLMFLDYGQVSSVCQPSSCWDELLYSGCEMQNNNILRNTNTKQLLQLPVKLNFFETIEVLWVFGCKNNKLSAMQLFLFEVTLRVGSLDSLIVL